MKRAAALSFVLWVLPTGVFAYDGSKTEQDACTPDVFNLCSAFIPDEKPIVACLISKRPELSPACAQVMFPEPKGKRRHARTAQE